MEYRPVGHNSMPPVVKNLLITNGIVFVGCILLARLGYAVIPDYLALHHWTSPKFRIWQLVTHLFMHGGNPADPGGGFLHLFSNMFALWMFGSIIENYFGSKRFLTFYMLCGIGAALIYLGVITFQYQNQKEYLQLFSCVGASGAVFGILFAFGYLFPNTVLYLNFLFPVKAKYLVAFYAAFELYAGIQNISGDNVAHFAHLAGMLVAFILIKVWNKTDRKNFY